MPPEKEKLPQEIQLLPEEELAKKKGLRLKLIKVNVGLGILLLLVQLVAAGVLTFRYFQCRKMARIVADFNESRAELAEYQEEEDSLRVLGEQTQLIRKVRAGTDNPEDNLRLMEATIPTDVTLTDFYLKGNELKIEAATAVYSSIFYFMRQLDTSEEVGEVYLSRLIREQDTGEILFSLKIYLADN